MNVNVKTYRNQARSLKWSINDYHAAVGRSEKKQTISFLKKASAELLSMECPRAKEADSMRAENLIDESTSIVAMFEYGITT